MDKVTITYKTADGKQICVEVSTPVKELLEQSDRQIRSQRRQDRRHLDSMVHADGFDEAAVMHPQEDVTDLLIRMESYERLHAALHTLSDVQRRRVHLYFAANMTHRQIAELESINHVTVGRSIKRAIRELQKHFAD